MFLHQFPDPSGNTGNCADCPIFIFIHFRLYLPVQSTFLFPVRHARRQYNKAETATSVKPVFCKNLSTFPNRHYTARPSQKAGAAVSSLRLLTRPPPEGGISQCFRKCAAHGFFGGASVF